MRVKLTDKGVYAPQDMTKEEDAMAHALLTGGWIEHNSEEMPDLPNSSHIQVKFKFGLVGNIKLIPGVKVHGWGAVTHYRVVTP